MATIKSYGDLQRVIGAVSGYKQPEFTAYTTAGSYTYTVPTGAQVIVLCTLIGGGGGGGGGAIFSAGSACTGGCGGAGGGVLAGCMFFSASELGASVSITVGAGGSGGAAKTGVSSNGNSGSVGNPSLFGTFVRVRGGGAGLRGHTNPQGASSGGWGFIGRADTATLGGPGANSQQGAVGLSPASNPFAPAGGGSGGGKDTSDVGYDGAAGGAITCDSTESGYAGTINGGAGGTVAGTKNGGAGQSDSLIVRGGSGGGGGAGHATVAGNGGDGIYGSGGGGGGSTTVGGGNSSGAGGKGGDGVVILCALF